MTTAVAEQIDTGKDTRRRVPKPIRPSVWTQFRVTWHFLTRLCGSVPSDPEMIQKWLEVRQPRVKAAGARSIQEINEEVLASLEESEEESEFSLLTFQRHEGALVQRYGTVRAHLKDCARVLSAQYVGRIKGERAFSTRVVNGVYLDEHQYWLPILRDGHPVTESSGFMDKAVHVRGPRGEPLNALKRIEYVEPPTSIEFTLKVLGQSVTEDDLHVIMEYGGTHGYAGERSDGEGRYEYEIERVAE
jgi:hypothetical protein